MIVNAALGLVGQVISLFGQAGKAKQEDLKTRVEAMKRSWTDEILVVYWFSPTMVGWFDLAKSIEMQNSMTANTELFAMQVAISAAVFGLGKINGRIEK
jgi:hypothetical protein